MGGVPVKHHTSSKVRRRRSQQALKKIVLAVCANCGSPVLPHHYCGNCGFYRGRQVKETKLEIKKK